MSLPDPAFESPVPRLAGWRLPPVSRRQAARALAAVTAAVCAVLIVLILGGNSYQMRRLVPVTTESPAAPDRREQVLAGRLATLAPRGIYVLVDTGRNQLRVYSGQRLLHEARCSTGTGTVLRDPRNGRSWVFDTPLGERRVVGKRRDPVWIKPDWAFIEEGYLPPGEHRYRYDDVSLGDYALYLGDGYMIHGTLFQTLLGRPVTHGCIRLGDKDLEYVYRTVPVGAPVYLY
jgi:L,D-transpeptidase YbiS